MTFPVSQAGRQASFSLTVTRILALVHWDTGFYCIKMLTVDLITKAVFSL